MTDQRHRALRSLAIRALPVLAALALAPLAAQLIDPSYEIALDNARTVRDAEKALGSYVEPGLAQGLAQTPWAAAPVAVIYLIAHLPVAMAVLGWVLLRRPEAWPVVSATFVAAQATTVALNSAWPCAPPSKLGVSDATASVWGESIVEAAQQLQNPVAAMPSGHVAWALVAGGALVWVGGSGWLRVAGLLWPALTVVVVLVTGNHFWLDAAAAVPVVALALALAVVPRAVANRRSAVGAGTSPVPARRQTPQRTL